MAILPDSPHALWQDFAPVFTRPTFQRVLVLLANLLRTAGSLAPGDPSDYRRVVSRARWSTLRLAEILARRVVHLIPSDASLRLAVDDTVVAHPGRRVFGKARHRDHGRSCHAFTAWRYAHTWVVLAVRGRFPLAVRPWALPVLVDLDRSEEDDRRDRRRHRTPAQHAIRLIRLMLRWFPDRRFVLVGDSA